MSIWTSGKFGHSFANSENPNTTVPYESSHQDFHCLGSIIRIFTVCLVNLYLFAKNENMKQTRSLSEVT